MPYLLRYISYLFKYYYVIKYRMPIEQVGDTAAVNTERITNITLT